MEDRKKPIMWDRKAVYTRKGINRNLRKIYDAVSNGI